MWHLDDEFLTCAGRVAAGYAGAGPPLILAHGWPWSSFAWHRVIPNLTDHYTVYWYDMPGYGRSEKNPEQATSLDVQGEVFREMVHHWRLERPTVIAHDFGGATTLRAHLLGGVDYHRLIAMNIVAMRPWGSAFFTHVGKHIDAFLGLPPHIHSAVVKAYIAGALVNDISDDDLASLVEPWLTDEGRTSFYRQLRKLMRNTPQRLNRYFLLSVAQPRSYGENLTPGFRLHEVAPFKRELGQVTF